jgi:hypothetical protein
MTKADIIARFPRLQVRGEGDKVHVAETGAKPHWVPTFTKRETWPTLVAVWCGHDPMTFSSPSGDFETR